MFEKHLSVQIKIILDQQPLRVGEGCLPDWLRKKKGLKDCRTPTVFTLHSHPKPLEEVIRPEHFDEFEATKKNWFAWDKWSNREPGLFKLEFPGNCGIALCSKRYYMENEEKSKTEISSKGVSQR